MEPPEPAQTVQPKIAEEKPEGGCCSSSEDGADTKPDKEKDEQANSGTDAAATDIK